MSWADASALPLPPHPHGEQQLGELKADSLFTAFPESVCFGWKQPLMGLYWAISEDVYHLKGTILIPTFAVQYEP